MGQEASLQKGQCWPLDVLARASLGTCRGTQVIMLFLGGGLHPGHIEVPRLGAEWELQLLALCHSHSNARSLAH